MASAGCISWSMIDSSGFHAVMDSKKLDVGAVIIQGWSASSVGLMMLGEVLE
jgi:hypothetical protein